MPHYSTKVLEHFHAPRNAGALADADVIGRGNLEGRAPTTELYLKFSGNRIERAGFTTFGCGASIACASMLTEMVWGQTVDDCCKISAKELIAVLDGLPADKEFCASIAVAALQDGIHQWINR